MRMSVVKPIFNSKNDVSKYPRAFTNCQTKLQSFHSRVNAAHVGQKVEADVVNLVEPHVVVHHRGRVVPGTTIDAGNT